jgi:hypothetical protein
MEYEYIIVQSVLTNEKGKHGPIHIKPLPNQADNKTRSGNR